MQIITIHSLLIKVKFQLQSQKGLFSFVRL
uniref:Uncharacterized protein n=1 Tax=Anguilla anguilla TaxID=7936 RepID=A0A0E9TGW7_ANGAN